MTYIGSIRNAWTGGRHSGGQRKPTLTPTDAQVTGFRGHAEMARSAHDLLYIWLVVLSEHVDENLGGTAKWSVKSALYGGHVPIPVPDRTGT
ncbi:unnamed protein product [Dibothriocephalus latus]|uniref:Uncharacterized protein n=1 Tax=Dibothriocephalus latus TaxID=60516 RepID=A0A3P6SK50_DIBLA|nr:unnamed protein product [Dibothriocephalus latus]